jgi:hypothetical protein
LVLPRLFSLSLFLVPTVFISLGCP